MRYARLGTMACLDPEIDSITSVASGNSQSDSYHERMRKFMDDTSRCHNHNMMQLHQRFYGSSSNYEDDLSSDDGMGDLFISFEGEEENIVPIGGSVFCEKSIVPSSKSSLNLQEPEHIRIATRLLRAHKVHVDRIMEILGVEMDALRDVDRMLEERGRLTEENVLDYFESVGLCLDQRSQTSAHLQQELDRISRGILQDDL